jgi:hypothetical protein
MLRGGLTWRKLSPTLPQSDVAYVVTILSGSITVCGSPIQLHAGFGIRRLYPSAGVEYHG